MQYKIHVRLGKEPVFGLQVSKFPPRFCLDKGNKSPFLLKIFRNIFTEENSRSFHKSKLILIPIMKYSTMENLRRWKYMRDTCSEKNICVSRKCNTNQLKMLISIQFALDSAQKNNGIGGNSGSSRSLYYIFCINQMYGSIFLYVVQELSNR